MSAAIKNYPHILEETLVPIIEAGTKHFPVPRSRQTLERWMREGYNGIILESATIGVNRYLSKEGIARFLKAQAGEQTNDYTPRINPSQVGRCYSAEEIAEKSRAFNLPD